MSFVDVLAGTFPFLDKIFHISLWSNSMLSSGRVLASSQKRSVGVSWQFVREVSSVMVRVRGESLSKKALTLFASKLYSSFGSSEVKT